MRISNTTGLKIKKYIDVEDTSEVIVIASRAKYKSDELQNYKDMFDNLKEDGVFLNNSFDDDTWVSFDDNSRIFFRFDIGIKPLVNTMLKCYVIIKMHDRCVIPSTGKDSLTASKKALLDSNLFSEEYIEIYQRSINSYIDSDKQKLYYALEFLNFASFENADNYIEIIRKVSIPPSKYRILPNYRSILLLDMILENYFERSTNKSREEYFPLLLWWKITKIIPMRPIEFSILKKDCCSFNSEENSYTLKIERRKQKNGFIKAMKIPVISEIKVAEEVFRLIQEYKVITSYSAKSEYLIPYDSYKRCMVDTESEYLDFINIENDEKKILPFHLRNLLNRFFRRVISIELKYEVIPKELMMEENDDMTIQKIQLGDTRHLALCGMMLQGFNPLTIAQLAGHSSFREQMSYYHHMETYIDANTYVLSKSLVNGLEDRYTDLNTHSMWKNSIIERNKLGANYYSLRKVEGGRCKSRKFPYECNVEACIFCRENFIYDETLTVEILDLQMEKIRNDISAKIECVKGILKKIVFTPDGKYDISHQEMLNKENNQLKAFVSQRGLLKAYRLKIQGDGTSE